VANAARVAAEIEKDFQVEVMLVKGFLGVFDVHVNGEIIFSKSEAGGRFPKPGEIQREIRRRFYFDPMRKKWVKRRILVSPQRT
jgi:predicted Rdx family selenoprotein